MSDYRIRFTVRNARLLRAIEASGHRPGPRFAATVGVSYGDLLQYLNLTRSPLRADGGLRGCALALCDFLGATPDELWADDQLVPLGCNSGQTDVTLEQIAWWQATLTDAHDPEAVASRNEVAVQIGVVIDTLGAREAQVIRERFGIGTEPCTLDEMAARHGISRERIRQIEMQAMRKLRHPARGTAALAEAVGITLPVAVGEVRHA